MKPCKDLKEAVSKLEDPSYSFKNFYTEKSLENVNVPYIYFKSIDYDIINRNDCFSFLCYNRGDIIKSFTINGKNIKKITLTLGSEVVWKSHYITKTLCKNDSIKITPFKHGILNICCPYNQILLNIYAKEVKSIDVEYLYLRNEDRKFLAKNNHIFDYDFIGENNQNQLSYFNKIIYKNGEASLKYEE